ncbi:hypothetical protein EV356DRAFT_522104 [Viridothelium virens]|uniref:NADH:quinone oxidoreductase/Mrp antiporter transmembrane domain-containing protein n=1 Tax=Viridothelium virens TaxID=1048519 RepID=A0A6A6GSV0_VIRVR|nr:hypothetical protein EV356DRAFT_522104 [Viridothelium virens]
MSQLALFHLINHAFYKGLLFLGAGAVIHAVSDNQDFRKYGALIKFLPLTYSVMLIASLSLVAFPFMTGFYSKDFILDTVVYFIATIDIFIGLGSNFFSDNSYNIYGFFNQRFLIELFYNNYITNLILKLGGQTTKVIDKGSIELLGPYGLELGLVNLSRNIASLDTVKLNKKDK